MADVDDGSFVVDDVDVSPLPFFFAPRGLSSSSSGFDDALLESSTTLLELSSSLSARFSFIALDDILNDCK